MNKQVDLGSLAALANSRFKNVPRGQVLLVVLVIVAVVAFFYLTQQRGSAQEEVDAASLTIRKTKAAITRLEGERVDLEAQVAGEQGEVESGLEPLVLATIGEALGLGPTLATYAGQTGVAVKTFDSELTSSLVGEDEFQTIVYTLAAQGSPQALIGILSLVDEVPSAVVQTLRYTSDEQSQGQWTMDLGLLVIYE